MRRETAASPEKISVSISSMSFSRPATTGPYPSTTRSMIEYRIASGPRASRSGSLSIRARTPVRSGDSLCRMLITKSGPTNTCSSPNSTSSTSSR